ncbi:MAG: Hsp20/alpha crystallin family protein [Anaerolineaceae bacterium]|nr:Hsp20/alpha crystallin family protein [Anaerolineaceae bacterium]
MTLYITTPFERLARRNLQRWFEDEAPVQESEVYFPINVKADADTFVITALLPGIKPEDLDIKIVNETVSLQGEFKDGTEEKAEYLAHELPSGRFLRVITLPASLDSGKAEAKMEDGVLTLRVPKAEEAKPKVIKVTSK